MSFDIKIYKNGFTKAMMISDAEMFINEAFNKYHPGDHQCAAFISNQMEKNYEGKWNCFIFPDSYGSSQWYAELWIRFIITGDSLGNENYHVVIFKQ